MVSLLKVDLVHYRCACDSWLPLSQLYFCRKCDKLKCNLCLLEDLEVIFCPNCMERMDRSSNESLPSHARKFTCNTCNYCPICENFLVARGQGNGLCYVQCSACHWTSRDAGIPDQISETNWPEHVNPVESQLTDILAWMKEMSEREKIEQKKMTKRLSNLGVLANDRFGLSNAYNMRKKALNAQKTIQRVEPEIAPTSNIPELDPSVFTEPLDPGAVPTLAQVLRQPLCGTRGRFLPGKVRLIARRSLRCTEPERGLMYRGELDTNSVKAKMSFFAFEAIPEVRLSQRVNFAAGQAFSIFLIVSNNAQTTARVKISGTTVEDSRIPGRIDCSDFNVDVTIPNRDNIADIDDELQSTPRDPDAIESEQVVMVKRHRYGIRMDCKPLASFSPNETRDFATDWMLVEDAQAPYALLKLSYNCPDETPNKWLNFDVRINLTNDAF